MFSDNTFTNDPEYVGSSSFFTRIFVIFTLAGSWIAAAAAIDSAAMADANLNSTRVAILVIAVVGFVESITILILSLSRIINELTYLIIDGIIGISLFGASVAAVIRENQVNRGDISGSQYRQGSLETAGIFGFISVALYILLVIFYLVLLGFGVQ